MCLQISLDAILFLTHSRHARHFIISSGNRRGNCANNANAPTEIIIVGVTPLSPLHVVHGRLGCIYPAHRLPPPHGVFSPGAVSPRYCRLMPGSAGIIGCGQGYGIGNSTLAAHFANYSSAHMHHRDEGRARDSGGQMVQ